MLQKEFWKFTFDSEISAFIFIMIIVAISYALLDNIYLNALILVFLVYYATLIYLRSSKRLAVLVVSLVLTFLDIYSTFIVLAFKKITNASEFMLLFRIILKSKYMFLAYSTVFLMRLVVCMAAISAFLSSFGIRRKRSSRFGLLELAKPHALINNRDPYFKEMLKFIFDLKQSRKDLEVNYSALRSLKLTVHRSYINYIWLSISVICTNIAMIYNLQLAYYIGFSYYLILAIWIIHLIVLRKIQWHA